MARIADIMRGRTPAARERRNARRARWQRPLATKADRRQAWASLLLADHGFLRLVYRNRHQVSGRLWRSAQPAPSDVTWAARNGIRTMLSVRADGFGGDLLEREACERHGLIFQRLVMLSRAAPSKEMLREAIAVLPQLQVPILVHCKSGADRAGLAAALYLIIVEGRSAAEAKRQLSFKYGHIERGKTGILDAFIEAYATTGEAQGIGFCEWVEAVYDPQALTEAFRSNLGADVLLTVLRRE
ncbi:MAG: sulfur transferase domain-containing protein [Devosia sp.]